jgi:hypothetical protein
LPNLVVNGGFETALLRWDPSPNITTSFDSDAHSGATSLKMCGPISETLEQVFSPALKAGTYYARMWARLPAGSPSGPMVAADMGATLCLDGTRTIQNISVFYLDIRGGCAVIDDVALYAVPDGGMPPECACQR